MNLGRDHNLDYLPPREPNKGAMPMREFTGVRLLTGCILGACGLFLAGCASPKPVHPQTATNDVRIPDYWKPYLLYLLDSPHPRLYVEADAVEGCAPSDAILNQLHDFLAAHCDKPGGIDIVRGKVIPRSAARGVAPEVLARKYVTGPPDSAAAPPPAFLCVIFYDGVLCDEPAAAMGRFGAMSPRVRLPPPRNPCTSYLPYPLIYMNMRYGPKFTRDVLLQHEAGHILRLVNRTNDASGHHCVDPNCLMYRTIELRINRLLLGKNPMDPRQKELCQKCLAELAEDSKQPPPTNLCFVGPVLVRTEPGYHVLSLPSRAKVIVGEFSEQDCRDFAAAVRAETSSAADEQDTATFKDIELGDPVKTNEILLRAGADGYEPLRYAVAETCWKGGLFADAMEICRQSILLDAKDDWSYNQIAWIKATCPEASLRDGKEAVSAASKACELTEWKNFDWIDTLAAAYAETGDFKRAVQFEEQALRTGIPPESDQKEMRERLSLYKQSRPFRDKP
jgi:hypothetical protein